jgi:hypothetical protein
MMTTMYRKIIGISSMLCVSAMFAKPVVAQQIDPNSTGYFNYVPTYSQHTVSGSARNQGLAGAGVSLGGDIGQVTTNPASLGFFRKSEMSASMGVGSASTTSSFLGSSSRANKIWFGLPNFGAVFNFSKEDFVPGAFRGGSLGISFTKVNDYQENTAISGVNNQNSMTDYFVDVSQGYPISAINEEDYNNPFSLQALAYNSFLTEYDNTTGSYYRPFFYTTSQQRESISKRAGQYAWDLSYGANFNDRVYLGIGGTMLVTNYKQERMFEEQVLPGPNGLSSFTFNENNAHRGTGFAAKLGAIVKVTDWMRLGGSFHTPTYNYMRETYSWGIVTNYDNVLLNDNSILTGTDIRTVTSTFSYRFVKPMRLSGGVTLLAGKYGFITGDVEYVPYATASIQEKGNAFTFQGDNNTIRNIYQNVVNYKVGAEARFSSIYRLRAGFSYQGDPYKKVEGVPDRSLYSITGGLGVRLDDYYVDFAMVQSWTNQQYKPYVLNNGQEPTATWTKKTGFYQLTAGVYF